MSDFKQYSQQPLFWLGLLVKFFLISFAVPITQSQWFIPFMVGSLNSLSLNPWGNHLVSGGDFMAFPYGIVMYLVYLPFIASGQIISNLFGDSQNLFRCFGLATLLLDFSF